jgi:transcriptional regulator with XRE-family HTH domain
MVDIGQRVRRIRREQDITQAGLASGAGMAKNSINKIERGHMNPSAESVARIAAVLGVPVGLLYEEPELVLPKVSAPTEDKEHIVPDEEHAPGLQQGLEAGLQHDLMADFAAGEEVLVVSKRQLGNMLVAVQRGQLSVEEAVSAVEQVQGMAGN